MLVGGGGNCHRAGHPAATENALPSDGRLTVIGSSTDAAKAAAALGSSPILGPQLSGRRWKERPKWPCRRAAVGAEEDEEEE